MKARDARFVLARSLVVLVVGFLASHALASTPPKGAPNVAYDEARVLYAKGDYAAALVTLERGQKESPDPLFFWNMAACEKKLGHNAKAIRYVERYLSAAGPVLTSGEKRTATQFLVAASAYVGTVKVTANIEGTDVFVDDVLMGTTPIVKALVVDHGEHTVRFARAGHLTITRIENVTGGSESTWSASLAPLARPEPRDRSVPPSPPPPSRFGPVLVGGSGVIVLGVGAVLTALSLNKASMLKSECATNCAPAQWDGYPAMQTAGSIMLGVGGAATVTAVVWWVLQPKRAPVEPLRGHVVVAPFHAGASVELAF